MQLALIALVAWCSLALLALPLALRLGRAALHADAGAQREYDALRPSSPLTV